MADRVTVAVVRTNPERVFDDYRRVLDLSGCAALLADSSDVVCYPNLTWHRRFPSVSSPPWQLEAVARAAAPAGSGRRWRWVVGTGHVRRPRAAAGVLGWTTAMARCGHAVEHVECETSRAKLPNHALLALDRLLPFGPPAPEGTHGTVALHLPTLKTHGRLGLAGALENAWSAWLPGGLRGAALRPHEVVVDLLLLQQATHRTVCAVMDGTVVGDGAGPRSVTPREGNVLLASTDPVALDAVAARLAGVDPFSLRYLALAYALGLGCADVDEIELVGDGIDVGGLHLLPRHPPAALARTVLEKMSLDGVEARLFRGPWLGLVASLYYDWCWYYTAGRAHLNEYRRSAWGALDHSYSAARR